MERTLLVWAGTEPRLSVLSVGMPAPVPVCRQTHPHALSPCPARPHAFALITSYHPSRAAL